MVVIADALKNMTHNSAKAFFESLGIIGKVRSFELNPVKPESSESAKKDRKNDTLRREDPAFYSEFR